MPEVKFRRMCSAIGRNGFIKQSGIDWIFGKNTDGLYITFQPLTSRGAPANCMIDLPVESVEEFIAELRRSVAEELNERRA